MALLLADLSKWNVIANYDMFCERVDGVYVKASEGGAKDRLFGTHWSEVGVRGKPRGAYCFHRPDVGVLTQVERFYQTVDLSGDFGELPPVLDVELKAVAGHVLACLRGIEERFGVRPLVYTNWNTWKLMGFPAWGKEYKLWVSNPFAVYANVGYSPNMAAKVAGVPAVPPPWGIGGPGWMIWQFTWSAKGRDWGLKQPDSKALDLNLFPGTVDDLHALDGVPGWPGVPNPVPPADPWEEVKGPEPGSVVRVVAEGLNVRRAMEVGVPNIKEVANKGDEFMVTRWAKDANYLWVETGYKQFAAMRRRDGVEFLVVSG